MDIKLTFLFCLLILTTGRSQGDITYVCPPCNRDCDTLTFDSNSICPHCSMTLIPSDSLITQVDSKTTIAFYLQSGVEVLDFAGPLEVLTYAGFGVFTVSKTSAPIISQGVLRVIPDYSISDAPSADILAFFGGNGYNTSQDSTVIDWVTSQEDIDLYFSVCTGALILAEASILDGLSATTFHNTINDMERDYPLVNVLRNVRYVDNGTVITTAGISAGIDGALHLVAKLKGYNTARATAYNMEYDNWKPNSGKLINTENPYALLPTAEDMAKYVGEYQLLNDGTLNIRYDDQTYGLEAIIDKVAYPLYHQSENIFTDVNGDLIEFITQDEGQVTGYRLPDNSDVLYSKL